MPTTGSFSTVEDDLALEATSLEKHELVNGEIVALAGASLAHNLITANLIGELKRRLRDRGCLTLASDQRVAILETDLYTYPDASVVCGKPEMAPSSPATLTNPKVIFEVLSDGTEAWDRGGKFAHYQRLPSLEAYVLVDQKSRRIEYFHRMPNDPMNTRGSWLLTVTETGRVALPALGIELEVDEVYADWAGLA